MSLVYYLCFSLKGTDQNSIVCPLASREQLRRRESSAAPGEEACAQAHREVLVWGRSGKRTKPVIKKMHLPFGRKKKTTSPRGCKCPSGTQARCWYPVGSAPLQWEFLEREWAKYSPPGPRSEKDVGKNAPRFCRNDPVSSCVLFISRRINLESLGKEKGGLGAGGARLHLNLDVHFGARLSEGRDQKMAALPVWSNKRLGERNTEGMNAVDPITSAAAQSCGFRHWCFTTQFAACLCSHRFVWVALLPWLFCEGFSFSSCIISLFFPPPSWSCSLTPAPLTAFCQPYNPGGCRRERMLRFCLIIEHDGHIWIKPEPKAGPQHIKSAGRFVC